MAQTNVIHWANYSCSECGGRAICDNVDGSRSLIVHVVHQSECGILALKVRWGLA